MTEWRELAGRLEQGLHVLPVRVYYEDTDFSGAVYHANYLKFCERGRSDCLRLIDIHHYQLHQDESGGRLAFVVREPYRSPPSGASLAAGLLEPGEELGIESNMAEEGVI